MSAFAEQVKAARPTAGEIANRRWIYVPYDRYTDRVGPLTEQPAADTGIVIVESTAKAFRRPYHKKKLIVLISNMRHFALEQQARGVSVLYHFSDSSHGQALLDLQRKLHLPWLTCMTPAERELRLDLSIAQESGLAMNLVPDATWASTTQDFVDTYGSFKPGKAYVMDRFYRRMRQQTGILMKNAKPIGGEFSYDAENRKPYRDEVPVPRPPGYPPDAITQEVIELVESTYGTTSAPRTTSTFLVRSRTAILHGAFFLIICWSTSADSKTPCATITANSSTPRLRSYSILAVCSLRSSAVT
jgi:deoxyribodipyrimidine photolyase-related protein